MSASREWSAWTTTMQVTAVNPAELDMVHAVALATIDDVDRACSRYRADSELSQLTGRALEGHRVSPVLARLLRDALEAARWSEGLVDPTLGDLLEEIGFQGAGTSGLASTRLVTTRPATWRDVLLEGDRLSAPAGAAFDLGAIGKATAADLIVERLAGEGRVSHGVLVSLGGDLATCGVGPEGGWQIDVQDGPSDPYQQVTLSDGAALATSSTLHRRIRVGEDVLAHILDPRTGAPASARWRSATCLGGSCTRANAASTAAIVLGDAAPEWLAQRGIAARLVNAGRRVVAVGGWPVPEEALHG